MEVKETLRTLLDHGSEFINTNSEIPFHSFLLRLLRSKKWTLESIRLLIRRGVDPGQYVPPWGGCLPLAIYGSRMEGLEELRDALILLIMNGADVYARNSYGRSATDIANDAFTKCWYDDWWDVNDDLKLKDIWTEALTACGYDPEEVFYRNIQAVELSDSDGDMDGDEDDYDSEDEDEDSNSDANTDEDEDEYDISEAEDEDNVITHRDYESITQGQAPELFLDNPRNPFICETWSHWEESTDDEPPKQTESAVHGHFDWSTLEDDTNVWRT